MPRWCPPIGRLIGGPLDARITRPWPRARQFPISRSERRASSVAAPPGGSRGRAHGYPGLPIGRPFGAWPDCRPCAECSPLKFIGGLSQTAMGATLALGATTFIPGLRLPVLSCFPAVVPRFAPSCVGAGCGDSLPGSTPRFWAVSQENGPEFDALPVLSCFPAVVPRFAPSCVGSDCSDSLPGVDPPGSGLFCRKTGLNLTSFRGSGRLFRFLAVIRVDGCGITPGRKHSHRWCPVPQPTKPPRTLLGS